MNIAPMARLDDGLLEVVAFQTRTRWRLVGRFRTIYSGTHLLEPGVDHFTCREAGAAAGGARRRDAGRAPASSPSTSTATRSGTSRSPPASRARRCACARPSV